MEQRIPFEVMSAQRPYDVIRDKNDDPPAQEQRKRLPGDERRMLMALACLAPLALLGFALSAALSSEPTAGIVRSENIGPVVLTHAVIRTSSGEWAVVSAGEVDEAAARGAFSDATRHDSAFGELHIQTSPTPAGSYSDSERAFAAGILEGFLTHERIKQTARNLMCEIDCSGKVPMEIQEWMERQDDWAAEMVRQQGDADVFWAHVGYLRDQFEGLMAGSEIAATLRRQDSHAGSDPELEALAAEPVTLWDVQLINALGDLFDIKPAVLHSRRQDFAKMQPTEASSLLQRMGHCTALIKVTDDLSDLLMGHSSWFHYANMNRIFKHYSLDFEGTAAANMSFSSYPGMLSSLDDFYLMQDTALAVTQTTNGIYNTSLYDEVLPESLLAWQRVRTANYLARSGEEWASLVARENSGTCAYPAPAPLRLSLPSLPHSSSLILSRCVCLSFQITISTWSWTSDASPQEKPSRRVRSGS